MVQVAERYATYQAEFDALRRDPVFGAGAASRSRERAFERFLDQGLPSTRDEEWRQTSVAPIAAESFVRAPSVALDRTALAPFRFRGVGLEVVVVNGRFSRALSSVEGLPPGVTLETAGDRLRAGQAMAEPTVPAAGPFVNLNDAFFEDVVHVRVAARAVVTTPIHVIAIATATDRPALVVPRLMLSVGEASEVTLIESYTGLGVETTLTSAVTLVDLAPGAVVHHVKIQREPAGAFHLATMAARVGRAATLTSHALTFGGRIARNDISALLDGEGAECTLNGLYVAAGDSLVDTHTTIDHAKPHCPSHEVYKGILAGRARAVFNGKILVRQDAQKTDAKQTNRALLLSDDAQVNTKPQLEIFADDVKCTHGAAIGQLDDDAMFYLRARGIDDWSARVMLIHAFAGEILDQITVEAVREDAMKIVEHKLLIG